MRKFHRRASTFDLPIIIDHDAWKSVKLRSVDKIDVGGDIKKEILITSVIPSSSKNRIRNDTCQNLLVFSLLFFFFYRDWIIILRMIEIGIEQSKEFRNDRDNYPVKLVIYVIYT